jgi:hypothetical protein
MGKIKQGILGSFSGTVATVVGSTWRGIVCMRGIATSHKDANTPDQKAQRARFGACGKFSNLIKTGIILPIWDKKAVEMTGSNLFLKTNQHCFDGEGNIVDYQNMKFSIGNLPLPENIVVVNSRSGNGLIVISWTDNSGSLTAIASDRLMLVTLTGNKPTVMSTLNFTRAAESATVQLANGAGETVHLYIFFSDPAGKNYSNSFYAVVNIPSLPNP